MRSCAWNILRGASDASTESTMVGAFAAKSEIDINKTIARQKKFLLLPPGPILPPHIHFHPQLRNELQIEYISLRRRQRAPRQRRLARFGILIRIFFWAHKLRCADSACRLAFELANYARSTLRRRRSRPAGASALPRRAARETNSPSRRSLRWTAFLSKSCLERFSDCSDQTARANRRRSEFSRLACGQPAARRGLARTMCGRSRSRSSG